VPVHKWGNKTDCNNIALITDFYLFSEGQLRMLAKLPGIITVDFSVNKGWSDTLHSPGSGVE
jgi:hypothetical protein